VSRSLPRRGLAAEVADDLRERILTGILRPQARIDQDALADEFAMSRVPVREALIALAQEGLVEVVPRRGTYVAAIEPDDVLDHYEMYGLASGIAAARAARRLSPEAKAELRQVHERFIAARGNAEREKLNEEFHRILNSVSGNRLRSLLRLLSRSLPSHYYAFASKWSSQAAAHHGEILAAVEAGDELAARRAMESHLAESGREAVKVLQKQGFWS
jgi:DNA-binding GntR family transcriptional regulator